MKETMPEEPNIPKDDVSSLSLEGQYTALPMQQGGEPKDEEAAEVASDELGAHMLVHGTQAERHEQAKETLPDQLIVEPKEIDDEATD